MKRTASTSQHLPIAAPAPGSSMPLSSYYSRRHELEGHAGCVNSVYFTPDGQHLLSGSDDQQIILWDWEKGTAALKWDSGHTKNVFQARQIGFGSKTIVSCAADGQVRLHLLSESTGVSSSRIGKHSLRAHKLALDPEQPQCFYSSGEDAFVRHYDIREKRAGSQKLLRVHSCVPVRRNQVVRLYGIHVKPTRSTQFAVGGNEEYVQIYDARMIKEQRMTLRDNPLVEPLETHCPAHLAARSMHALHHVTSCMFSSRGELLVTYNNDDVYLFHPWLKGDLASQRAAAEDGSKRRRGRTSIGADAAPPKKYCNSSPQQSRPRSRNQDPCSSHALSVSPNQRPGTSEPSLQAGPADAPAPEPERAVAANAETGATDGAVAAAAPLQADDGHQGDLKPEGQSEVDTAGFAEEDEDATHRELENANNAAEELLRGLFDELVTNSDSANAQMAASSAGAAQRRLRIRRRGSAAASNQERASHARAGPNVSEQRGSPTYAPESEQAPHVPSHWEDEAEANVEEEAEEEVEEEDEDDDEEEEEDEDEGSPSNLSSDEEWDEDDEPWLNVLPQGSRRFRQLHKTGPMPPHCLQGYVPEEPSTQWLQPRGDAVVQRFRGHKNVETVKGVTFFGSDEEYVASGSDCGNLFVWSKRDGLLRCMQPGDSHILNCIAPHPTQPFTLATSGIDDDVKVWGVKNIDEKEQKESVSKLEQTLLVNVHRNYASSFRSRLFVPFLLGARWDSMDF